jgi:hypothetical protein
VVRKFSVSAVKRRGRLSNCKGREDFALAEVDDRYPALLQEYEEKAQRRRQYAAAKSDVPANAEPTPSELAYTEILQDMKADFPNIDWLALRNKHSAWNTGRFDSADTGLGQAGGASRIRIPGTVGRQSRSNRVCARCLPKTGVFADSGRDFCRNGVRLCQFGSSETGAELQKPANSGLFCSLRGSTSDFGNAWLATQC